MGRSSICTVHCVYGVEQVTLDNFTEIYLHLASHKVHNYSLELS